jgi:DNA-directed RNA polymerase subunit beta
MSADKEDNYTVAQPNAILDDKGQFLSETVEARKSEKLHVLQTEEVDLMDVSPNRSSACYGPDPLPGA